MVDVLRSNFSELFPAIRSAIEGSSFISIDTEFTGLNIAGNEASLFDTLQKHYKTLANLASNIVICQLGLTAFTKSNDQNVYLAETFNFYLCPQQCGSTDRRFLCQASSVNFLSKYKFDFNKFAYYGIPYLNEVEEERAKTEIENGTLCAHHFINLDIVLKKENEFLISDWLASSKEGDEITLKKDFIDHEHFQLHLLRQKYPSTWASVRNGMVVIEHVSNERRKKLEESEKEEEMSVLEYYMGFSYVFKVLKDSQKILVGHNCLLDLLLIYNSFFRPLPETFSEFKRTIHSIFPNIYDTKHIWANVKNFYNLGRLMRDSSLYSLRSLLKNPPENLSTMFSPIIKHMNCPKYDKQDFPHDAGYDSFLTGWVFIKLCHILAMAKTKSLVQVVPQSFRQHLKTVEPFCNKVNITRARVHYIDLAAEDPVSHRPQLLHVKQMDSKVPMNLEEIGQKLGVFGHVEIQQIGRGEALVAVGSFGCAKDILRAFSKDKYLQVTTYSSLRHSWHAKAVLWFSCVSCGILGSYLFLKFCR